MRNLKEVRTHFSFNEFKKYALFLIGQPDLLSKIADVFYEKLRDSSIPSMQPLDRLPQVQYKKILQENVKRFLEEGLKDTLYDSVTEAIQKVKNSAHQDRLDKKTMIADVVRVYEIQKQLFINFLDQFTQDLFTISLIVQELDQFLLLLHELAFNAYPEGSSEDRHLLSSLIHNSLDGIIAFDQELRVTQLNAIVEEWCNIKQEEVVGRHIFDAFPLCRYPEAELFLSNVLKGEKVSVPERSFPYKEGFYEGNIVPLFDNDGLVYGGICIFHETTEKRKTEAELRESQMLFQKVADTSPTVLFVYDIEEKRNIFFNKVIGDLLGYDLEEFRELTEDIFTNLFHPDDAADAFLRLEEMKKMGDEEVQTSEYRMKDSKGNWHWFRSLETVFKRNDKGEVIQILGSAQEITEIKEKQETILRKNEELASLLEEVKAAQQQLKEVNEELEKRVEQRTRELVQSEKEIREREMSMRAIADAMPVFIAYMRKDKTFGYVNKAYEEFFHVKREKIIGKTVGDILGEELYMEQEEFIERSLRGELVKFELNQNFFGSEKWFNLTFIPNKVEGEVDGIFVLVEDISGFKNIQFELEGKNKDLQRINTELDNFVYVASHDLRSPVNNLDGLLQILREKFAPKANSEEFEMLRMTGQAISRLKKTIEDLIDVIKVQKEGSKEAGEHGLVRFEDVTRGVKEDIKPLILQNHPQIEERYEVESIYFYRSHLRSIIFNLLSNAVKYRSPNRPLVVEIRTFYKDDFVVLSVKDNGMGLSFQQLKKLFSLFKRMHEHIEGTGIGLYSIKRIIENSGGKMEVKSEEGKGSQFLVFLPSIFPSGTREKDNI